jgi:hypothetical protein
MTTFSMYSASIPVFKQILNSLHAILDKAEAHAADKKIDPARCCNTACSRTCCRSRARSRSPAISPRCGCAPGRPGSAVV